MGKKGPTRHLKRHQAPTFWSIHRKENVWTVRSSPGPHTADSSFPIAIILRDILKIASTSREVKTIAKQGKVKIDGKVRTNTRFPIGLMDIVSLPDSNENYRVLPDKGGRLLLFPIKGEETSYKLCRIIGKNTLKNNSVQLRLHDGKSLKVAEGSPYNVNDVIKIRVPSLEIIDHVPFKDQLSIIVTGGRSQGETGTIIGFGDEPGWKKTATVRNPKGEDIRTLTKYVFPVGISQPLITLPES